jgi:hypothetical protein
MSFNSPHGGSASLMSWSRQSGTPAVLLSRAPPGVAVPHGFLLGLDVPFLSLPLAPASPYAHAAVPPRMLAACGSPRALGDVPMLLSEQRRWGSCVAVSDASAAALAVMATEAALEERCLAPASPDELQAARSGAPISYHSFGADSKIGFDDIDPALLMDVDDSNAD